MDRADHIDHVDRETDRPGLVPQPASDGLTYPPGGVGGELEALAPVELLDGPDQPQIPLLDEVEDVEPPAHVTLGY